MNVVSALLLDANSFLLSSISLNKFSNSSENESDRLGPPFFFIASRRALFRMGFLSSGNITYQPTLPFRLFSPPDLQGIKSKALLHRILDLRSLLEMGNPGRFLGDLFLFLFP